MENSRGMPNHVLLISLSKELEITVLELLNIEKIEDENDVVIDLIKNNEKNYQCIWSLFNYDEFVY